MPATRRPNILWISFEDTNPFYGCYGDPVARTPNVDRLAAGGCIYPRAFSTAGVCAPARSAVITGMYPISIGTHQMRTTHKLKHSEDPATPYSAVLPSYVKCFTEYLRQAGYYCTNNVKTDYQFDPPRTAWDECSDSAHWRNRPDPDQPFFAVFNPTMTHESGMWPQKCPEPTFDPDAIELPPYFPDTPKVREAMARMYTNIETADGIMGKLLDQLEEDGLAENTIVMHWSDHGPLPRGKRWPYDSGIRIPMIVRWPGQIEPGTTSDRLVSTVDLGPTVLSLAGVEIPQHLQGKAFLGADEEPERSYIYASRDRYDESYDMIRAVRDKRWKYIRNYHPELPRLIWVPYRNRHPIIQELYRLQLEGELAGPEKILLEPCRPAEELYDTQNDPHEIENLARNPECKQELQRLRDALDAWLAQVGDMGEVDEIEMVRRWYPDKKRPQTSKPFFVPINEQTSGREDTLEGGRFQGPMLLQICCSTQGASIAWTDEQGEADEVHWNLYSAPMRIEKGRTLTVRARAIRIGYLESDEVQATFECV